MAEYKDVERIKKRVREDCGGCWNRNSPSKCPDDCGVIEAIKLLDSVPPVDAVPVVRCKDCKHREFYGLYFLTCERHRMSVDADYYCADGIREDGGDGSTD